MNIVTLDVAIVSLIATVTFKKKMKDLINSKSTIKAISKFNDSCNVKRMSINLRRLLLEYIAHNKNCLPIDFDIELNDFVALFEFFDSLSSLNKNAG